MENPEVFKLCQACLRELENPGKKKGSLSIYFPATLRTWNRYCPRHQSELKRDVASIISSRIIPVEWFDVYRPETLPNGQIYHYHVCRACGADLIGKNGKHYSAMRWCKRRDKEHGEWVSQTLWNWSSSRADYALTLAENQIPLIQEQFPDLIASGKLRLTRGTYLKYYNYHHDPNALFSYGLTAVICENCGRLATINQSSYSRYRNKDQEIIEAQVHHKIPVHALTLENIMLMFDSSNFICLCMDCHWDDHRSINEVERKEKFKKEIEKKYIVLDKFFG